MVKFLSEPVSAIHRRTKSPRIFIMFCNPDAVFNPRLFGFCGIVAKVMDSMVVKFFGGLSKYINDAAPMLSMLPPYGARFRYAVIISSLL